MNAILKEVKKELLMMRQEDTTKLTDAEARHEAYKRTQEKELNGMRDRIDYVIKEFFGFKNKAWPATTSLEGKVRTLDSKLSELRHHHEAAQKRLEDLSPLLEMRHGNQDLRHALCDFVFDAWNKQYEDVFQKKNEYMRNFDMQEQRNKTYTNDIREVSQEIRVVK